MLEERRCDKIDFLATELDRPRDEISEAIYNTKPGEKCVLEVVEPETPLDDRHMHPNEVPQELTADLREHDDAEPVSAT